MLFGSECRETHIDSVYSSSGRIVNNCAQLTTGLALFIRTQFAIKSKKIPNPLVALLIIKRCNNGFLL